MSQVFSYLLWTKTQAEEEEIKSIFRGGVDEASVQVFKFIKIIDQKVVCSKISFGFIIFWTPYLQEYTSFPVFILLKSFRDSEEGSKAKQSLLALLVQMKELQSQLGYLLLLLLAGGEVIDGAGLVGYE